MTAIASFATSLIPVAHMEIRQGYQALLGSCARTVR